MRFEAKHSCIKQLAPELLATKTTSALCQAVIAVKHKLRICQYLEEIEKGFG